MIPVASRLERRFRHHCDGMERSKRCVQGDRERQRLCREGELGSERAVSVDARSTGHNAHGNGDSMPVTALVALEEAVEQHPIPTGACVGQGQDCLGLQIVGGRVTVQASNCRTLLMWWHREGVEGRWTAWAETVCQHSEFSSTAYTCPATYLGNFMRF